MEMKYNATRNSEETQKQKQNRKSFKNDFSQIQNLVIVFPMATNDCITPVDDSSVLREEKTPLHRDISFEGTFFCWQSADGLLIIQCRYDRYGITARCRMVDSRQATELKKLYS